MDPVAKFHVALSSPEMVGRKDRDGWVGLFATDGFVEDPVEAGRYQGKTNIQTFWDVFIGPQPRVGFDIARDFWGGDVLIRQATVVSLTQAHPQRTLDVPALICYSQRGDRVRSLQALWEPRKVIAWFFGLGLRGLWALSRHGVRMMARAGLSNALSFGGTLVGGIGKTQAEALVKALFGGGSEAWFRHAGVAEIMVGSGAESDTFRANPEGAHDKLEELAGSLEEFSLDQLLVCGHHVAAFFSHSDHRGAVALMIRATKDGTVATMTALWSAEPRVLSL